MKLTKNEFKIASQIYTYLKSAQDDDDLKNVDVENVFQQLTVFLLSHKQKQFCDMIAKYSVTNQFNEIINVRRNNKDYTLLMIAASNRLADAVKCLLEYRADPYLTKIVVGRDFNSILHAKIKNNQLTVEQIEQYKKIKKIDATAFDIARTKDNNKSVIDILKKFF